MNLSEVYRILEENITANDGNLNLAYNEIDSPPVEEVFSTYLLNENLVILDAILSQDDTAGTVTVTGTGDSLLLYKSEVTLVFTINDSEEAEMAATTVANGLDGEDGWTMGAAFPRLVDTNLGGYYELVDDVVSDQWSQYLYWNSATFQLSTAGLFFTGDLKFEDQLAPLSVLFNGQSSTVVSNADTFVLNTGTDGVAATSELVVPEFTLSAAITNAAVTAGNYALDLALLLQCVGYVSTEEESTGQPSPIVTISVNSNITVNEETAAVQAALTYDTNMVTFGSVDFKNISIGLRELISLANNEDVLAILPSNIPLFDALVISDWQMMLQTDPVALLGLVLTLETEDGWSWTLIPNLFSVEQIGLDFGINYFNGSYEPSLTLYGTVSVQDTVNDTAYDIDLYASYPGFTFGGQLDSETPILLSGLIGSFLQQGADQLPTMYITELSVELNTVNSTYSAGFNIETDWEISTPLTTIAFNQVGLTVDYVNGVSSGTVIANFTIGTGDDAPQVYVSAGYEGSSGTWTFEGGLEDGSEIDLGYLIDTYLPSSYTGFDTAGITITELALVIQSGDETTYDFSLAATWDLDLSIEPSTVSAATQITYNSLTDSYTGFIMGDLNLGNINFGVRVDFNEESNAYSFYYGTLRGDYDSATEFITFGFTEPTSLGDLITWFVKAATGKNISLPFPWSYLNDIDLSAFSLKIELPNQKMYLSYPTNINLGFVVIKEFSLTYEYGDTKKVNFEITEGTFLGTDNLPDKWDVTDPNNAPNVPGDTDLFKLEFLGLGQHVSLKSAADPSTVSEAVDLLEAAFKTSEDNEEDPIDGTGLEFNAASNWLIATRFTLLDAISIGLVFNDPQLYGLSINAYGDAAKVFKGLEFEVLYKQVTDSIGMYQVDLTLPEYIRQIEFGAVSVTLPSLFLQIYTNGDFKIDFGFPSNGDFSRSFGLQALPFTGAGGFYFGLLSAETADTVPTTTEGNFSPVIVFGIGLQAGIGKTVNKGVLKAGLSLTLQGILEGTFARYNPYDGGDGDLYYYVQGELALVGRIYGEINFAIVTAQLDITVFVSARVIIEAYEPLQFSFSAGVKVSLKVKVNLGLFKVKVNLSFSTTITEAFTIGSSSSKPWGASLRSPYRSYSLSALDEDDCPVIAAMDFLPLLPDDGPVSLEMLFLPQFTAGLAYDVLIYYTSLVSGMLYLESSIEQDSTTKTVIRENPDGTVEVEETDYPFDSMAKGILLWVLAARLNTTGGSISVSDLEAMEVTADDLSEIICYFSQSDSTGAFTYEQITAFLENYFDITVILPEPDADMNVSVFPMFNQMSLVTPDGTTYFSDSEAQYTYTEAQLTLVREYFQSLSVSYLTGAYANESGDSDAAAPQATGSQSLATYMMVDYFALIGKEACQRALDLLNGLALTVEGSDSLSSIVESHPNFGISAEELGFANRRRTLSQGATLLVEGVEVTVKHGQTASSLAIIFGVEADRLLSENGAALDEDGTLIEGSKVSIPSFLHTCGTSDTLLSVANLYHLPLKRLVQSNLEQQDLFPAGSKIRVTEVESITVGELITAMDDAGEFQQLSGLSANIMLQGLRVPLPSGDSEIGSARPLYQVTGQEFAGTNLKSGDTISLNLSQGLDWLNLGTDRGTELAYPLGDEDIAALQSLSNTQLDPQVLSLTASPLYDIQNRRFTLPNAIEWTSADAVLLANGDNDRAEVTDPTIWKFRNDLGELISGTDAITPQVELKKRVQETERVASEAENITSYSWSTMVEVQVRQVFSNTDSSKVVPMVYEVQGIDQASQTLLKNLVEYLNENSSSQVIDRLSLLYALNQVQDTGEAPEQGLQSASMDASSFFLLQTNLSTLSNPGLSTDLLSSSEGSQADLLGMSAQEFITLLWEASVTNSGGYYLYYEDSAEGTGLPDYLFSDLATGKVTLMITYTITDDILQNFINSVVISEDVDIANEIVYVETVAQALSSYTLSESESLADLAAYSRTRLNRLIQAVQDTTLRQGKVLSVPGGSYTTAAGDTLRIVADRTGASTLTLGHLNRDLPGLVEDAFDFDSRVEVKVATVPPGNAGFELVRTNPDPDGTAEDSPENQLRELYNLLCFAIQTGDEFYASNPGLPITPADQSYSAPSDPNADTRPSSLSEDDWQYARIFPLYPYAKSDEDLPQVVQDILIRQVGSDPDQVVLIDEEVIPPSSDNPYRAVGKTASLKLNWQDIFGNTDQGDSDSSLDITDGYIDPVLGIDQWSSVNAGYIIENDSEGSPQLLITLAFNPANYIPEDSSDESWKVQASADLTAYRTVYYQLVQADLDITVSNSISGEIVPEDPDLLKTTLVQFVLEIYQYLYDLLQEEDTEYDYYEVEPGDRLAEIADNLRRTPKAMLRANPEISLDWKLEVGQRLRIPTAIYPSDAIITLPVSDNNSEQLFALTTSLRLSRDLSLVADDFKDEPSVVSASATIGANLDNPAAQTDPDEDNRISIQEFAEKLQAAFPSLKVATGQSQSDAEDDTAIDLWVARFDTDGSGINFTITNPGSPEYYGVKPLSTSLISDAEVPIYPYTTGTPIYEGSPSLNAFNGVDLERLAIGFLAAMDQFLGAEYAVPAWKVENSVDVDPDSEVPYPYQAVIEAKEALATSISATLDKILDDGNAVDSDALSAAQERLRQQLLITLSDAYSINAVIQFQALVDSVFDGSSIAPRLFGKVLDPNAASSDDKSAYAFSTSRFSLEDSGADQTPVYFNILFSTKQENDQESGSSSFQVQLQLAVNALEHQIENVEGIDGYQSSNWLTFVLPFDFGDTSLGELDIPIPLRAYPTAPSMLSQDYSQELEAGEEESLDQAKIWNYAFSYDYVRAQQDTIDLELSLNTFADAASITSQDDAPNLFVALLQFSQSYQAILNDLNTYLLGGTNDENAYTAMQSFAWLAGRVATAWGSWSETKAVYAEGLQASQQYSYQLAETQETIDEQDALVVVISAADEQDFQLPEISIQGYSTEYLSSTTSEKSFAYYTEEDGVKTYLSYSDGLSSNQRTVNFSGFNIIETEDAWAGLSIVRNQNLVDGVQTNPDFVYETPVIRFANALTPLLDLSTAIDIGQYTSAGTATLETFLSNFFQALFSEIDTETTTRKINLGTGYQYDVQAGESGLLAKLPISITTPLTFSIPDDWDITGCAGSDISPSSAFVCQISALIQNWFASNLPSTDNGRLNFDLSLFSNISDTKVPVLRIRNLYLYTSAVTNLSSISN